MKFRNLFLLVLLSLSLNSRADFNDIELGLPSMGGQGCPNGTASATLSPDKKALSILFDEFLVEAGGGSGRTIHRKSCNIAIPVHIPQGWTVSLLTADYRGFVDVPRVRGAFARFTVEYFFAGIRGPRISKIFRGGYSNDYVISNNLAIRGLVWARCGADVNLRVNAGMMIKNRNRNIDAMATVDSADFTAGIIYKLSWRRC